MIKKTILTGNVWRSCAFSKKKDWKGALVREVYHHGVVVEKKGNYILTPQRSR